MKNRLAYFVGCVALCAAALVTAFTYSAPDPAEAQGGVICVKLPTGQEIKLPLGDALPLGAVEVPCAAVPVPVPEPAPTPTPTTPAPAPTAPDGPKPGAGKEQERGGSKKPASRPEGLRRQEERQGQGQVEG